VCGRFTLRVPVKEMALVYDFETKSLFPAEAPRYNIAPVQPIATVWLRPGHDKRELVALRWGRVCPADRVIDGRGVIPPKGGHTHGAWKSEGRAEGTTVAALGRAVAG
jgi:putative SOS response-associated peptidase YedK